MPRDGAGRDIDRKNTRIIRTSSTCGATAVVKAFTHSQTRTMQ